MHHLVPGRHRPDRGSGRHPRRYTVTAALAGHQPRATPGSLTRSTIEEIQPEVAGIATYRLAFADSAVGPSYQFRPGPVQHAVRAGHRRSRRSRSAPIPASRCVAAHDADRRQRDPATWRGKRSATRSGSAVRSDRAGRWRAARGGTWSSPAAAWPGTLAAGDLSHPRGIAPIIGRVFLLYGARTPGDLLYARRVSRLARGRHRGRDHRRHRRRRLAGQHRRGPRALLPAPPERGQDLRADLRARKS